ncbi:hypothetical protein HN011_012227 [Eciton burchellii]|nr:hypothetical protein HN011_011379 [Eciton burchellii]KAH0944407.1 hypothetical protein HN011_012227 [Eciton burchellii]
MEDVLQAILQVETEMSEMKVNLTKEQGKSAGLQSALLVLKEDIRRTPTYASVARSPQPAQRTQCIYNGPKKHVLFVQSSNKEKSSRDVKEELMNKVNPRTDKIKIKGIRQTRTNSVVMEFDTRDDLQKFKEHPKLISLKIEEPKKRNPLMILYDVDSSLTASELKENIIQQNLHQHTVEEEDIVPRFKTGPRNKPTVHWVIQMAPSVRKYVLQQGNRPYMGFSSLKVRDFLQVARCLKCHDLGHVAKQCSGEERYGRCGATDHKKSACKSENQVCIPCNKRKLKCNTKREDCTSYRTLFQRQQENTDYGD